MASETFLWINHCTMNAAPVFVSANTFVTTQSYGMRSLQRLLVETRSGPRHHLRPQSKISRQVIVPSCVFWSVAPEILMGDYLLAFTLLAFRRPFRRPISHSQAGSNCQRVIAIRVDISGDPPLSCHPAQGMSGRSSTSCPVCLKTSSETLFFHSLKFN